MKRLGCVLMMMASMGFAADKSFLVKFHKALVESLPPSFEAELQGVSITKKLSTIPQDMIKKGAKPAVKLTYSRTGGMKLEVVGLTEEGTELYGDIFQPYVKVFTLGPLLLSVPSENAWDTYTLTTVAEDEKSAVISLSPKNTVNEYVLYIDKTSLRLQRLDFKGSGFFTSTLVKFVQKGNYWIPEVFLNKTITEDGGERLPERYQLVNIKVGK